jgi:hypothetical protein
MPLLVQSSWTTCTSSSSVSNSFFVSYSLHPRPYYAVPSSDWFAPGAGEVDEEVAELHRVLAAGGMVFWRSAARCPWYNEVFERAGFEVEVLGMREGPQKAIDRVNMCVARLYLPLPFSH